MSHHHGGHGPSHGHGGPEGHHHHEGHHHEGHHHEGRGPHGHGGGGDEHRGPPDSGFLDLEMSKVMYAEAAELAKEAGREIMREAIKART